MYEDTTKEDTFNNLIETEYNPKEEVVRNEKIKNTNRYKDMGINLLDSDIDYSGFEEFKKNNEEFMNQMNNASLEEKTNAIKSATDKFINSMDNTPSNRGKLVNVPDGYAIELDNGEILYTDKNHNIMERALEKERRRKEKENEENQKLLNDEYNALLKRQEMEEKERERIKNEEEKYKRQLQDNVGKFMAGLIGGVGINSLMNRR